MDIRTTQLEPGRVFHVFNRGVNGGKVFFEKKNFQYFLRQYDKYVGPYVNTYAYCLLGNHFHLMIRVKLEGEFEGRRANGIDKPPHWIVSNAFSSFFQSYTRGLNKVYKRSGPLFESPFKRIAVRDVSYFTQLIRYIHCNPSKHQLSCHYTRHAHSSFLTYLRNNESDLICVEPVLDWFGGLKNFERDHQDYANGLLARQEDWMID